MYVSEACANVQQLPFFLPLEPPEDAVAWPSRVGGQGEP